MKAFSLFHISLCLLFLGAFSSRVAAQSAPAAFQQAQQYNRAQENTQLQLGPTANTETAPELFPGESADVGPQYILQLRPTRKWFEANADAQYFYTSNAFLNDQSIRDTGLLVTTAQVAVAPTAFDVEGGQFSPRLGFRYQWYNYGLDSTTNQLNNLDFDVETVFTDYRYRFDKNWIASVGFDWNRLLSHEPPEADYSEFYSDYVPSWSLERQFPLNDSMLFSIAYIGAYHFTNEDPLVGEIVNDRLDESIRLTFTQEVISHLYFQPFYSVLYTDYTNYVGPRNDFLNSVGVTFSYIVNDWFSARTFVTYDILSSDNSLAPQYHDLNAGGGLSFVVAF